MATGTIYDLYLDALPDAEGLSRIGYLIEGAGLEGDYDELSDAEKETALDSALDECRERMTNALAENQYYCEKCGDIFEYRDAEQQGCEKCNATIGDNQIAEQEAPYV